MTRQPSKLLVEYLKEDRQWHRHLRIKYARRMLSLIELGIFFRNNPQYDRGFWQSVLQANGG